MKSTPLIFLLLAGPTPSRSFQVKSPLISTRTSIQVQSLTVPRAQEVAQPKYSGGTNLSGATNNRGDETSQRLTDTHSNRNSLTGLFSKLRPLLLSLFILLLTFSLALPSFAVQSGGRIGGSVGGSGRSSSGSDSRSYGGSGGYSRGYSSGGYYSRPSVVVTPGITPYYRWVWLEYIIV